MDLAKLIREGKEREASGKQSFEELDEDLCMICHAYGPDKRNLVIRCFYAIHEFVPEALDMRLVEGFTSGDYYLRVCKVCRSGFLVAMADWRDVRVALRAEPKDSDGDIGYNEYEGDMIPVRIAGATVMLTPDQYEDYKNRMRPPDHNSASDHPPNPK